MKKVFVVFVVGIYFVSMISALSMVVHVPETYTEVSAGERFYFEMEVKYPENPSRKDLRISYEILNEDEEVIAQSKVLKAIETQASFMDFIVIPEGTKTGMHIIKVSVEDYENLHEEVESSFYVIGKTNQMKVYYFILLGVVVLVGILVVISIIKK